MSLFQLSLIGLSTEPLSLLKSNSLTKGICHQRMDKKELWVRVVLECPVMATSSDELSARLTCWLFVSGVVGGCGAPLPAGSGGLRPTSGSTVGRRERPVERPVERPAERPVERPVAVTAAAPSRLCSPY